MRILIDMGHPAHVHFFRYAIAELKRRSHDVLVTAQLKNVMSQLLEAYAIPYEQVESPPLAPRLRPLRMLDGTDLRPQERPPPPPFRKDKPVSLGSFSGVTGFLFPLVFNYNIFA